jgi:hypoxanthine-DNA glycosylase
MTSPPVFSTKPSGRTKMDARGFEPKASASAKVLILGTLPGEESLRRGEYYASPQNAFWRIVESLFGIPADEPNAERTRRLNEARVALWVAGRQVAAQAPVRVASRALRPYPS